MVTSTEPRPMPQAPAGANRLTPAPRKKVAFGGAGPQGHRIVLYGPGGIGKSTLSCLAPGPVAMFDLDESLPVLRPQLPNNDQVNRVVVRTWQEIRDTLHMDGWDEIKTVIIDSVTKAEELCAAWVIKNVKHEKKEVLIERLEDYGWGKGLSHVYDEFLSLLADLDAHVRAGRNIILIAHDCTATVPNPHGEDWLRYEPRLQSPASGKNSIRLKVREWADHVIFLGYDVSVESGKGQGSGTRTLYPCELPHCMAKSRTVDTVMPVTKNDPSIWTKIIKP